MKPNPSMSSRLPTWAAFILVAALLATVAFAATPPNSEKRAPDEVVSFADFSGQLMLDGYVWRPATSPPYPAVVAMHGCGGVFFDQPLDTDHIAGKFTYWGQQLSELGFLVLMVDGFTTRGIGHEGVCAIPPEQRPPEVNATLARPFDAHAGLSYLRSRLDVRGERLALLGWSNGGTAVLSTVASAPQAPLLQNGVGIFSDPTDRDLMRLEGFAVTASIYPGCGFDGGHYNGVFEVYSDVEVFMGANDVVVDPMTCQTRVDEALMAGSEILYTEYAGLGHGYDYEEWQTSAAQDTRTRVIDRFARGIAAILIDGFETGDTSAWSSEVP